jgi:hypothetical protein
MSDLERRETSNVIVRLPDVGGFPVDNINYWRIEKQHTTDGPVEVLTVYFKQGGFIWLDSITEQEFASLVYGEPF